MSKHRKIDGQFVARTIEMLRSPAMGALSLSGRRILDRIEIELASHGGKDNGKLPVTFADFEEYGTSDRHTIGRGLREVCALGLVENTRPGQAGGGEFRSPNLFRLTYLPAHGKAPTHEWRKIKTLEEAEQIAHKARRTIKKRARGKHFPSGGNHTGKGVETTTVTSGGNHTVAPDSPVVETTLLSREDLAISSAAEQGRGYPRHPRQAPGTASTHPRRGGPVTFHRTNQGGRHGESE